jgi:hypothetical protein
MPETIPPVITKYIYGWFVQTIPKWMVYGIVSTALSHDL